MSKIADVIRAEIVRLSTELDAAKRALQAIEPNHVSASTKTAQKRTASEATKAKMRAAHAARKLKASALNGTSMEASDGTA